MNSKFLIDLATGHKYEELLLKHIPFKSYIRPEGYFKEYDLMVYKKNGSKSSYEVKADKQINIYGNICIEYQCRNKPSGITTSTAKYWAIYEVKDDKYALYKIPSKIIREYINKKLYHRDTIGGDYKASKLYLFKKDLFKDYIIYNDI